METTLPLFVSLLTNELSSVDEQVSNYYNIHLKNTEFLDIVKCMDYNEFLFVIDHLFSSFSNHLLNCCEFIEFDKENDVFISFTDDRAESFPIEIKQKKINGKQSTVFKGYSPYTVAKHIVKRRTNVLFLPLVIEEYIDEWHYHQTVYVINLKNNTSFLYDPNGYTSKYCNCNIHIVLSRYTSIVNEILYEISRTCSPIKYDFVKNRNINYDLPIVGSGNCMICCILFMFYYINGYTIENIDNYLSLRSKTILIQHHIVLYNLIGNTLKERICSL